MTRLTKADQYLDLVFQKLKLSESSPKQKYKSLQAINEQLDLINAESKMSVKTTGTINERLVQLALEGYAPDSWYKLTAFKYQWLGDFGIQGYPLSVIISVKSFKTKERLLVSGTGSLLAPTVGWGRFEDADEFNYTRLEAYLFRGFLAIYMPQTTLNKLKPNARNRENFFNKPLLRPIDDFGEDLEKSLMKQSSGTERLLDISIF